MYDLHLTVHNNKTSILLAGSARVILAYNSFRQNPWRCMSFHYVVILLMLFALPFKTYCLGCHNINGVGGRKVGADIKLLVHGKTTGELRRWISDPRSVRSGTAMPPLNENLDEKERGRVIDQIVKFLGVL